MLRNVLLAVAALIALYIVWNLLQFLLDIFKDRRSKKSN